MNRATSNTADLIRDLEKLRARWRTQATREFRLRQGWKDVESVAKSYGMDITYQACANDLDVLLSRATGKKRT